MTIELALLSRVAHRGQEITAPRLRGLLALLAADLRTGCGTPRLVEGLWPDEQPDNPAKAVQILVSRLRSQLGADVIATTPTGYRLALADDQVDTSAVLLSAAASARHARACDHAAALAHAEAGLALWDGTSADGGDDPVSELRAERAATQRSLRRSRALALARLVRPTEAVEALTGVMAEHPMDEEVLLELLRCEAATAGPPAALARYETYRRSLRDDLGLDPGPALLAVYRKLLEGEAPAVRHGVQHEPNPLIGRDHDIAAVLDLVRTSRVTSIVGPGGLGKTRLAHAVSRAADQRVVHVVSLACVLADDDVVAEIASAIGAGELRRTGQAAAVVAGALSAGPVLLVLDNCEQVVHGVADLVRSLVSATRDLRVLTTSRAPLGLSSESVYLLPELDLPTSVELFEQRARAVRPGVDLPADAVADLCRRLDGLPLAVELAAARVRIMSVPEIAEKLRDRFTLLRGARRDSPARHQTLSAVVDWSWNLLEPAGQAAMRALSVFPGGFTAAAAARLGVDTLDVLPQLVDQSLLKVVDTPSGTRLRMLETVCEFSTVKREEAGESDRVTSEFLAWAREFGLAHHESIFGHDPFPAVDLIRAEQDNLVQALRTGLALGEAPTVAAVAAALAGLWTIESNYARVVRLTAETAWMFSHYRPAPDFVEAARVVLTLSTMHTFIIEGPRAVRSLVALRRLPAVAPDTAIRALALVLVAVRADRSVLEALCDSDEPLVVGAANGLAGYLLEHDGDLDESFAAAKRMLTVFEDREIPWLQALAHCRVGELALQVDQGELARRHMSLALPVLRRLGSVSDVVGIGWWMVLANLQTGDVDQAEQWLDQTAPCRVDEEALFPAYDLGVRAEVLLARGETDAGLRLWRRVVDNLRIAACLDDAPLGLDPWIVEAQAVAVVAHARHKRLDQVEDIVAGLPERLAAMLANHIPNPPLYLVEFPIWGVILLALGMVDIDGGCPARGARRIALAERLRYRRSFQPTMSIARVRDDATRADRSAYDDAVSSYAALGRDELRDAALASLRDRG